MFSHNGRMLSLPGALDRRDVATPADFPWPYEMDGNMAIGHGYEANHRAVRWKES
jgi:hypothetical protein